MSRVFRGIVTALLAVPLLAGCNLPIPTIPGLPFGPAPASPTPAARQRPSVVVSVTPAKAGDISSMLTYAGAVQPRATVNVVPKAPGRIEKMYVDVGSVVKQGDIIAELDHVSLDAQVAQAEANVLSAQARLDTYLAGGRPEDVTSALAGVDAAQARLDLAMKGPTSADVASADSAVVAARSSLSAAQQRLADVMAKPKPEVVRSAELVVQKERDTLNQLYINRDGTCGNKRNADYVCNGAKAQAAAQEGIVARAINDLNTAKMPATPEELKAAQDAVTGAQAALDSANSRVAYLKTLPNPEDIAAAQAALEQAKQQVGLKANPYTDRDVRTGQAGVAQAQAALDVTKAARAEANIVTPFDGVVSARLIAEGGFTSTNTPLVTLVSNDVEVLLNLEEANLGKVQVGLPVTLTVAAYPGQPIPAKISSVNPTADTRTHTFPVKVSPTTQDGKLRGGMFADVRITAEQRRGVVLVPKDAIVAKGTRQVLFTTANGVASQRDIKIGIMDEQNAEIISGVSAGDQVVIQGQATLNDNDPVRMAGSPGGAGQGPGTAPSGAPGGAPAGAGEKPGAKPGAKPESRPSGTPTPAGQ